MSFENLIGNEKVKQILKTSIENNKILHSYMFIGIEGIGKKKFAKEFAKMVLCTDGGTNCGKCKSCMEFEGNNNPDFYQIKPDGNNIKIEQIRKMQSKVAEKPIISNRKVYLINDAEKMTKEAQNCLLKTLEEPPEYVSIILIVKNESMILSTIKSRCTKIVFEKIDENLLKKYLKQQYQMIDINDEMLKTFEGSIGKALKLKDKQELYVQINNVLKKIYNEDIIEILNSSDILYKSKEEIQDVLEYINVSLFEKIKINSKYINCIKIVEETKKRIKSNCNYDMAIDNMLFGIWKEVKN